MFKTFFILAAGAFAGALASGSAFAQNNTAAMTSDHMSSGAMSSLGDHMSTAHSSGAMTTNGKKAPHKKPAPAKAPMANDSAMSTGAMSSGQH